MRFTIERIRTLVLVAAVLLLVALGVFLAAAKWRGRFRRIDLPQRLAKEIQQESLNFDYTHSFGAHSKFRIHAAKAIQLKNDHIDLQGVEIDLYGEDGTQADRIKGDEFEYDEKRGVATAKGPVEMLLTRPPAQAGKGKTPARPHTAKDMANQTGQVEVKTSGVAFDRNTGVVTTAERVKFVVTQGSGSAVGASYDAESGHLTLMQAVDVTTYRGQDEVRIHAQHAEFDRGALLCQLRAAALEYRSGEAHAVEARIVFRDDGSAVRLDATGGFQLTTAAGGRLASPTAAIEFDAHNQPQHGHLEGGVTIDSAQAGNTVHGVSPSAELDFNAQGQLRHAHLERGVTFESDEASTRAAGPLFAVSRTWRSPVADLDFRTAETAGQAQLELTAIRGTGGVTITSESRRGATAPVPAKMQATEMTGTFGSGSALRTLLGTGDAELEETTATGSLETASGDRLLVNFAPPAQNREQGSRNREPGSVQSQVSKPRTQATSAPDVQTAELDGHVVLFEQPAAKPGAQPQPPLRATAGKAMYESTGEWLHLTGNAPAGNGPRIVDGGLELTAETVDVSRQSGDAFAHGNVKATWNGGASNAAGNQSGVPKGSGALGGNGPAHVIAAEAHINQSTGEAAFRGHARLWQQANSIAAPEIVLNQHLQTLTARTADAGDPVRAVLLSAGAPGVGNAHGQSAGSNPATGPGPGSVKGSTPAVIRVRGGDLEYSDAEHRAVMHGGVAGAVVAETGTATSTSETVELRLIPAGNLSGGPAQSAGSQAQVDRMTAKGSVALTSEGRRGTGEQLVYEGATGDYVLTGTAAMPPRMSDAEHGSVTGETLIFHSRDDSVSIEGGQHETRTETIAPQAHAR